MSDRNRENFKRADQHRLLLPPPHVVPDVPRMVNAALDELDEPDLTASEVAFALWGYLNVVSKTREALTGDNNDWLEFAVSPDRDVLERAMPHCRNGTRLICGA